MVGSPSRTPSSCPSPARRAACRSTSTAAAVEHPLSDGDQPGRRQQAHAAGAAAAAAAQDRPPLADRIEAEVATWWKVLEARAKNDASPINPQRVFWELSPRLPEDAILTCDSGTSAAWYARDLKARRSMTASLSGNLATMGAGRAVRVRREVRLPRPPGDRAPRRRRDADERAGRAHHGGEVLASPGPTRASSSSCQQPRPQPGHLGAAGDVRRPEEPRDAARSRSVPLRPTSRG